MQDVREPLVIYAFCVAKNNLNEHVFWVVPCPVQCPCPDLCRAVAVERLARSDCAIMRAPSLLLACLLGFAAAGGVAIIDNRAEAAVLLSAAVRVPEGDYLVESVGNDDKTLRSACALRI